MVGSWLPEPPNDSPMDELEASDDLVIPGTDTSDTEDDEAAYDGYEPLPLGPTDVENTQSSDEEDDPQLQRVPPAPSASTSTPAPSSLPPIVPMDRALVQEVWSAPTPHHVHIEMDSTKANEVKMAMANFTLPTSSIPEWATTIPEDQWKEQLINRIQNMQDKAKM